MSWFKTDNEHCSQTYLLFYDQYYVCLVCVLSTLQCLWKMSVKTLITFLDSAPTEE